MKKYYLVEAVSKSGFWAISEKKFRAYYYAYKFESRKEALDFAEKEIKEVFKIIKVYDNTTI